MTHRKQLRVLITSVVIIALLTPVVSAESSQKWIRPDGTENSRPVWGMPGGISVGLWPTPGTRGLLRIYTPYLDQQPGRIMNFIAVEPIVAGQRCLSEMEKSQTDGERGKKMWTADSVELKRAPPFSHFPARGVLTKVGGFETLSFFLVIEPFDNGAKPVIQVTLRSDRPHEFSLKTFSASDGKMMSSCVLTATMGNFARLRRVQLRERIIDAGEVFQSQSADQYWKFFPWTQWPIEKLQHVDDDVVVSAFGELDHSASVDVPLGWRYEGKPAIQTWRTRASKDIVARVNGRATFWGTTANIPGGPAFENFELLSPFESGQEFRFSIEPQQDQPENRK